MIANAPVGDEEKSLQSGMGDHLGKPIDTELLYPKTALTEMDCVEK